MQERAWGFMVEIIVSRRVGRRNRKAVQKSRPGQPAILALPFQLDKHPYAEALIQLRLRNSRRISNRKRPCHRECISIYAKSPGRISNSDESSKHRLASAEGYFQTAGSPFGASKKMVKNSKATKRARYNRLSIPPQVFAASRSSRDRSGCRIPARWAMQYVRVPRQADSSRSDDSAASW